jgi:DNA-directed RNA polymerase subunit F
MEQLKKIQESLQSAMKELDNKFYKALEDVESPEKRRELRQAYAKAKEGNLSPDEVNSLVNKL